MGGDGAMNQDQNWEEALRVWPDIVSFANDHGRKITLENCPMLFSYDEWPGGHNIATSPRMWRRILEQWGGTIGLNFDPSHLILQMIDIRRFLKEFGPHVLHYQAKDLMIDRDGLYERGVFSMGIGWQIPRIPGLGEVDWSAVFSELYRPGTTATASSSTRTAASKAPTRRSSRASSSPATSCARTATDPATRTTDVTRHRQPDRTRHREDDRPLAPAPGARRCVRRGRLPAGRGVRRRVGLRAARRRPAGQAILDGTDVAVGTTVGFPHGNTRPRSKVVEAREALADGATELDMVLQIGALKSGRDADVEADIRAVVEVGHAAGALVKVIFENAYLTDDEKIRACGLTETAGADFVKT